MLRPFLSNSFKLVTSGLLVLSLGSGCQKPIISERTIQDQSPITGVILSPLGDRVLTMHRDQAFRLWNVSTGSLEHVFRFYSALTGAAFSKDGTRLVGTAEGGPVKVWDVTTGMELASLPTVAYHPSFSADGRKIFIGGAASAEVWDVSQKTVDRQFSLGAILASDGIHVAAMHRAGILEIWDIQENVKVKDLKGGQGDFSGPSAVFSSDQSFVIAWNRSTASMWHVSTGRFLQTLEAPDRRNIINVAFSPDGSIIAMQIGPGKPPPCSVDDAIDYCLQSNPQIKIYDRATGAELGTIVDAIFKQFSPDSTLILTYDSFLRGRVQLWNARTAEPKLEVPAIFIQGTALFSPQQQRIITVPIAAGPDPNAQPRAQIWDDVGQIQATLDFTFADEPSDWLDLNMVSFQAQFSSKDWVGHYYLDYMAQFSVDGRRLAVLCTDGVVRIWDVSGITS